MNCRIFSTLSRLALGLVAAASLAACELGSEPKPQVAARLDIVAGDDQEGRVGTELPNALVVKVTDERGRPVRGQIVIFRVVSGGGSVFAGTAETNEQGEARERWTLGISTATADSQRVEARAVDAATGAALVFATFSAIAHPDVPAGVAPEGPATRTAAAGSVVADSLAVRVADRYGNPVPNVDVTWSTAAGGSVSPTASRTDASGVAKSRWTLGGTAGGQTATAAVAGEGTAAFTATVGPGAAVRIAILPTQLRLGTLGRPVQVTVSAADAFGNAIVAPATLISRNAAVASLEGTNTVQARGNGSTYLVATVQGVSDSIPIQVNQVPATITLVPVGTTILPGDTLRLRVTVADSAGNIIANPQLYWSSGPKPVAVVDQTGLVYGTREGFGPISVTAGVVAPGAPQTGTTIIVREAVQAAALDGGGYHTCTAQFDGATYCWGANVTRQLGSTVATTGTPQAVSNVVGPVAQIAAGGPGIESGGHPVGQTCTVTGGGAVACWGNDIMRQLAGSRATEQCRLSVNFSYPCRTGAPVSGVGTVQSLASGALHTCSVNTAGEAYCWGSNRFGELGSSPAAAPDRCPVEGSAGTLVPCSGMPIRVTGGHPFREVSAGASFTCGVTSSGDAYCWGLGRSGQLGVGGLDTTSTPVPVQGGHKFVRISSGAAHTCGIRTDERLLCWGAGGAGQLGNGSNANSSVPVLVAGNMAFRSVGSGAEHTCAITTGGAAYCWGNGDRGELGAGPTFLQSSVPVAVAGGRSFMHITAGMDHSCGVIGPAWPRRVYCWGSRQYGAAGGEVIGASYFTPQPVLAPAPWAER